MHVAYLEVLLEELERRGIRRAALPLPSPRDATTPEQLAELCRIALELTGDPALGLHYGSRLNLASHGILGYALMSSRDGDQLLKLLTRYAPLAAPSVALERVVSGDELRVTCRLQRETFSPQFVTELVLATLVSAARALFNRPIPGAAVWLDYAPPPHADAYRRILKLPVRFAQPVSALVCSRSFLELSVPSANPAMAELCARQCEAFARRMRTRVGLGGKVRDLLLSRAGEFPDCVEMARLLGTSERTLRRRLAAERTSYRAIVEEVRRELATRYLSGTSLPVTEVAGLLGYDDPANFRRAFKRWLGVPPQQFREAAAA